jgi:hypothetical protein
MCPVWQGRKRKDKGKIRIKFLCLSPDSTSFWKNDSFSWGQNEKMIRAALMTLAAESTAIVV